MESQGKPGEMSDIAAKYFKLRCSERSHSRLNRLVSLVELLIAIERYAWNKHFISVVALLPIVTMVVIVRFIIEGFKTLLRYVDRKDFYG